jgi:hypothetical protein
MPYLSALIPLLVRRRVVWLLLLFAAEAYTGTVLRAFDDEIAKVVGSVVLHSAPDRHGWQHRQSDHHDPGAGHGGWAKSACAMSAVCWAKRSPSG